MSAQGSPISANRAGSVRSVKACGVSFGSATSSQVTGAEIGAPGQRAHGVGGDHGLPVGVAGDVDEDLVRRASPCARAVVRMSGRSAANALGERSAMSRHLVGVAGALQWRDDVDAAAAAQLGERRQPEVAQHLRGDQRRLPDLVEVLARRVQIEDEPVGLVALVAAWSSRRAA